MTDTQPSGKPRLKINKYWLIGGGLAAAGVFYLYRKRSATAVPTTPATDTTDSSVDPATGLSYADESGSFGSGITTGSPWSALSGLTYNAQTGQYEVPATGSSGTVPTDNMQYAQQVTSYLESLGYDPQAVSQALGVWLSGSGQTLTQSQSGIVQAAQGYFGSPPSAVPAPNYSSNGGQAAPNPAQYITGDLNVDNLIANSGQYGQYLQQAAAAYKATPTQATLTTYQQAINAASYQATGGKAGSITGQ